VAPPRHDPPQPGSRSQLPGTQALFSRRSTDWSARIPAGRAVASLLATLEGALPGPSILLRADWTPLPVQAETGLDFLAPRSRRDWPPAGTTPLGRDAGGPRAMLAAPRSAAASVRLLFPPVRRATTGPFMLRMAFMTAARAVRRLCPARGARYPSGLVERGRAILASCRYHRGGDPRAWGPAFRAHDGRRPIPISCANLPALQPSSLPCRRLRFRR